MADDPTNKPTAIPLSTGSPVQDQAGRYVIQDRIAERTKLGDAVASNELYEVAYKGIKPAEWGTFEAHISKLNKRLAPRGLQLVSTTWYRLVDKLK